MSENWNNPDKPPAFGTRRQRSQSASTCKPSNPCTACVNCSLSGRIKDQRKSVKKKSIKDKGQQFKEKRSRSESEMENAETEINTSDLTV